eukprot:XP_002527676.2 ubiquitin carboxyl-terminal hydrolase 20 [Ricinus communis]
MVIKALNPSISPNNRSPILPLVAISTETIDGSLSSLYPKTLNTVGFSSSLPVETVHIEAMGLSPSNCNESSSISIMIDDSDKTLTESLPSPQTEGLADGIDQSFIGTQNCDSVVSTNGNDQSSPGGYVDDMCLVPVSVIPREARNDNNGDCSAPKPAMKVDAKEGTSENENNLEANGLLPDYPYDNSCNCNNLFNPYYGFQQQWPGPCGPLCEYQYSRFYGPRHHSRERWGNGEDEEDMPCWRSVQETVPTGVAAGLYNLGNTCFINAVLQSFTHTVPLVKALRSCNHVMPCQRGVEGFCAVCALRDHIELSLTSSGKAVSPSKIVDNLKQISSCFEKYQQEDAHEFLQCLLDKLERCCLDPGLSDEASSSPENNIVERVFGGRLVSKLRCCNCGHCSDKYEPLIDLSLEIEDVGNLQSALESFTKVEKIEDVDSKFICNHCKEEGSREKQLMLDQAPSVSALHLKRFKTDGSFIEKIDKHVEFPLELNLKPYTKSSQDCNKNQVDLKYQLYAIVVHNGLSPTSGHYFCFVRSSPSTWHKLDDCRVVKVEEEEVLSQAAYILFYVRDGTPWFSSLIELEKDSSDPSISNTSPKSVLDRMVTGSTACPLWENFDQCKAESLDHHKSSVSISDVEKTSNHFSCVTVVEKDEINAIGNGAEGISAQILCGSGNSGPKLCYESSRADVSMTDVSVSLEATNSHEILHDEKLGQGAGTSGRNDVDPLMPPRSSSPDLNFGGVPSAKKHIRRDHLKVERLIDFKKPKKAMRNHREEALRYVSKNMAASRRSKLIDAILPQNDKKRRLRSSSSSCKQASPPGARSKISQRSAVLH